MLTVIYSARFHRDFKLMQKRNLNMQNLTTVMKNLENEVLLLSKHKEHPLVGNYKGFLECHIEPDWLLIYKIDAESKELYFARTGTHSDLY